MERIGILEALQPVVEIFERLGVTYYVGGSVASAAYGIARATLDVDLVADIKMQHVASLAASLEGYYIDENMIVEAIRRRSSFSVIHLGTMVKVDVFIMNTAHQREAAKRRRREILDELPGLYLSSPEDIILHKLEWFRMGGEVSERQWNDVIGILKVQGNALHLDYLQTWAVRLQIEDLLERALDEVRDF